MNNTNNKLSPQTNNRLNSIKSNIKHIFSEIKTENDRIFLENELKNATTLYSEKLKEKTDLANYNSMIRKFKAVIKDEHNIKNIVPISKLEPKIIFENNLQEVYCNFMYDNNMVVIITNDNIFIFKSLIDSEKEHLSYTSDDKHIVPFNIIFTNISEKLSKEYYNI